MNVKDDVIRQVLNSNVRNNANNPTHFFKSLVDAFNKYNIATEPENIQEWEYYATLSIYNSSPFVLVGLPPFINKTQEFYCLLIKAIQEAKFIDIKTKFDSNSNETDRQYLIYQTLKPIEPLLKDISRANNSNPNTNFIYNVLNITVSNFYFEIIRYYSDFIQSETLTADELLYIIDKDYQNNKANQDTPIYLISEYLKQTESKPKQEREEKPTEQKSDFNPIEDDIKQGYTGKFDYETIAKSKLFQQVEGFLYEQEFIDNDYNFTNKHDKKKELACIFKLLIEKGYFKKRNYKHNTKDFQPYEYRQYLDHRYTVDTSQQFSRVKGKDIKAITQKYYFLETL